MPDVEADADAEKNQELIKTEGISVYVTALFERRPFCVYSVFMGMVIMR